MQLVADESCDFSVVVGLRACVPPVHDVISIAESMRGSEDNQVIEFASTQRRLLLTEDKDFGQLVFSATKQSSSVVLIRYPTFARSALTETRTKLLTDHGEALHSCLSSWNLVARGSASWLVT